MLFQRKKHVPSVYPETGTRMQYKEGKIRRLWRVFPIAGFFALIWFLVRVIPKPSRAAYPCQRAAFPLASSFVIWLMGLAGSVIGFRSARRSLAQAAFFTGALCLITAVAFVWLSLSSDTNTIITAGADPLPANAPIGVAKGIYTGRVAWIHDPNAANWPGADGNTNPPYWHSDTCTDPQAVNAMLSKGLRAMTGQTSDYMACFGTSTSRREKAT
jgi:hypothetical protein